MALKAVGHMLMIRPDPIEKEHKGIILVRDEKLERAATDSGTVVDIGETAWFGFGDNRPWVKIGDKVLYKRYSGVFIKDPKTEEEFVIINDDDLKALVVEE
jgi:co-chaperonin GroES (HSP10)